jgi:dephospho-CoA kinase
VFSGGLCDLRAMRHIVVTGGAGSGKSRVSKWLTENKGAASFSADDCVHELLTKPEVTEILAVEFGASVLNSCGEVDRPKLRDVVFSSSRKRARLEQFLHPLVFAALNEKLTDAESGEAAVFVSEIPLYFESGAKIAPDLILLVACSQATQIMRLCMRLGVDESLAKEILSAQMPTPEKMKRADQVIWNDGSEVLLERQLALLGSRFSS